MGMAKKRGSFEDRKQDSIQRKTQERILFEMKKAEIEASKTPSQRERERFVRRKLSVITAIAGSFSYPGF